MADKQQENNNPVLGMIVSANISQLNYKDVDALAKSFSEEGYDVQADDNFIRVVISDRSRKKVVAVSDRLKARADSVQIITQIDLEKYTDELANFAGDFGVLGCFIITGKRVKNLVVKTGCWVKKELRIQTKFLQDQEYPYVNVGRRCTVIVYALGEPVEKSEGQFLPSITYKLVWFDGSNVLTERVHIKDSPIKKIAGAIPPVDDVDPAIFDEITHDFRVISGIIRYKADKVRSSSGGKHTIGETIAAKNADAAPAESTAETTTTAATAPKAPKKRAPKAVITAEESATSTQEQPAETADEGVPQTA